MEFSIAQEGALTLCEARGDALIALIDAFNAEQAALTRAEKPWWRRLFD